jgi:hypothetical protein
MFVPCFGVAVCALFGRYLGRFGSILISISCLIFSCVTAWIYFINIISGFSYEVNFEV